MTTVLITGGTGILGCALTEALVGRGDVVHTAQRRPPSRGAAGAEAHQLDVSDTAAVASLIGRVEPDLVLHLAAELMLGTGAAAPAAMRASNERGTANVLAAVMTQTKPAAVITASSERAYAPGTGRPLTEEHPLAGQGLYGETKAAADRLTRAAAADGLRATVLRLSNTYGPHDPVATRIVPSIVSSVIAGEPLRLRSASTARRDFLHVADAVTAYVAIADRLLHDPNAVSGRAFNVGTGVGHSVLQLAERAAAMAGEGLRIELPDAASEPPEEDRLLDASLITATVGWEPAITLDEGLAATLDAARAGLIAV